MAYERGTPVYGAHNLKHVGAEAIVMLVVEQPHPQHQPHIPNWGFWLGVLGCGFELESLRFRL